MRPPSIFLKTVRDLRWQVFWYGVGCALMAALVIYIYPSYSEQLGDFDIPDALRALIGDVEFNTPKGFVAAEFMSWVPIILVVFAVTSGTGAIGGEEANGTLDLLLSQPISRTRLALEKLAGLFVASLLIVAITWLGWLISVPFVDIDIGLADLAIATANMLPLVIMLQSLACLASVTLASRGVATGAVTAFAIASYFVNYLASLVEALEPLQVFSVFYHYHGVEALTEGVQWAGLALLLGLYVAFSVLVVVAFQRREVGSGRTSLSLRWPLRKPTEATDPARPGATVG